MAVPDRSWTITPTLLWFGAFLVAGLIVFDGNVKALANRLSVKREDPAAKPAGPAFAPPTQVAEAEPEPAKLPPPAAGSHDVAALNDACIEPLGAEPAKCKQWAMDGYYRAVAGEKQKKLGRAVRVSWYGDSVVADDQMAHRLRERLQGELGDGGPGYVYVVPPHKFNENNSIKRSFTGTWYPHSISLMQLPDGLYGVGGSSAETEGGRSTIKLATGKVTSVELYYLATPKGGTATVMADGSELVKVDTSGDREAKWASATIAAGASAVEIKTEHRVRFFGIDLENASGAVVDNLGVVSSNVKSFANNTPDHWQAELGHRAADLILIMIGANEAEWLGPKDQDTKNYQAHYEKVLEVIRKARPDGSCLVISPTDQAEAKDDGYESRPVMPVLVEAQKKAAAAQGCAFYSTYAWMGGKGSAAKWFKHGLVSSDFQHLSKKGADKMADALYDALVTGYGKYAPR